MCKVQPPKNAWPSTAAANNTLFFAQAMHSFLDKGANEGFRAYALDTLARIREVYTIAEDISRKRVSTLAFGPVAEELSWSLAADKAASEALPELMRILLEKCKASTKNLDVAEMLHLSRMAINRLYPVYRGALSDWVVRSVELENQKADILASVGFFTSHLLNDGHSRFFLLNKIEERFFSNDIARAGSGVVRSFIDSISEGRREYKVIGAVPAQAARIISQISDWQFSETADLPNHAQNAVSHWDIPWDDFRYITMTISSSDPFRAGEELDNDLSRIKSQIPVGTHRQDIKWLKRSYVHTPRSSSGINLIHTDESLFNPQGGIVSGRRLREVVSIPKLISSQFEGSSSERLSRAMSTAAVAYETSIAETRLISLWSALEVLLGDPPEESARIKHFAAKITPCICLRYHRRLFSAVHEQLSVGYRKRYKDLLSSIESDWSTNPQTKLVRLITLPQYENERRRICHMCGDNPLALHRLFRLRKFYGHPRSARESMLSHKQRVEWQVHRIYRARNNLVHAGTSPPYLDALVQNSVEYLRTSISTIVKRSVKTGSQANLDQVISEIGFEWKMQLDKLAGEGSEDFTEDTLKSVFAAL